MDEPRSFTRRLAWMVIIWVTSVGTLGLFAQLIRMVLAP